MVVEPGSFRTEFRGRSARESKIRISDYDEILGRTGSDALADYRVLAQAEQDYIDRHEQLTLSTDAAG